jgi:hypothetical protein
LKGFDDFRIPRAAPWAIESDPFGVMKAAKLGAWAIESDPFGVKKAAKLGAFGEDGHIRQVIWAIEFIWAIESDPFGVKKAAKLERLRRRWPHLSGHLGWKWPPS